MGADLPADGNPALGINGMDLKHRFGEVQADCCDLSHDLHSLSSTLNGLILAPSGAGAIHPIVNRSSSCSGPQYGHSRERLKSIVRRSWEAIFSVHTAGPR